MGSDFDMRQQGISLFRIECVRIEIVAGPLQHPLMLLMFRVGQNGEQIGIAVWAATIFRRTCVLTRQAMRFALALGCNLSLNYDFVYPVVAKVVAIPKFSIWASNFV